MTKKMGKLFNLKSVKLGFNPAGRMLWIGKTHQNEDLWIGMAPNSFNNESTAMLEDLEWLPSTSTKMESQRVKILLPFLVYVLEKVPAHDLYVSEKYPDLNDGEEFLETASNIL